MTQPKKSVEAKDTKSRDSTLSQKEANYLAERTVEEIVEEFGEQIDSEDTHDIDGKTGYRVADWLTQTLKAERQRCDEMVEAERERKHKIEILNNGAILTVDDTHRFYGFKRMTKPLMYEYEITLTQPSNPKIRSQEPLVEHQGVDGSKFGVRLDGVPYELPNNK